MSFTIYTKDDCVFCTRAKKLLEEHGKRYHEYKFSVDFNKRELAAIIGLPEDAKITLPQIFESGFDYITDEVDMLKTHVGGYEQLVPYLERPKIEIDGW